MQNYIKRTVKKLTKYLVLKTAKRLFISGPSDLAHAKKKKKHLKKKHYKFACFYAPQNVLLFLDQAIWRMQKSLKNDQNITQNHKQFLSETTKCPNFYISKKILKSTKKAPSNSQEVSNMKIYKKFQRYVLWEQIF
jgi:hypothetical protein